jgi:tRNA threonylcarbamoyl adenosine modification protein YeaZ
MRVLAIDTALNTVSACVFDTAEDRTVASEILPIERGHDEHLLPLVERVLAQTDYGLDGIDRIAVTIGPGSFTGIRIGIAAARAMGLVRGLPVIGIPTLIAFAAPYIGKSEFAVASLIDARHGQVYAQVFSAIGKCIVEPRMVAVGAAVRLIGSGPVYLTGNAAPVAAIEAWSAGLKAEVAGETGAPDIAYVARLGALAEPSASPPLPLYLAGTNYKTAQPSRLTAQPAS